MFPKCISVVFFFLNQDNSLKSLVCFDLEEFVRCFVPSFFCFFIFIKWIFLRIQVSWLEEFSTFCFVGYFLMVPFNFWNMYAFTSLLLPHVHGWLSCHLPVHLMVVSFGGPLNGLTDGLIIMKASQSTWGVEGRSLVWLGNMRGHVASCSVLRRGPTGPRTQRDLAKFLAQEREGKGQEGGAWCKYGGNGVRNEGWKILDLGELELVSSLRKFQMSLSQYHYTDVVSLSFFCPSNRHSRKYS